MNVSNYNRNNKNNNSNNSRRKDAIEYTKRALSNNIIGFYKSGGEQIKSLEETNIANEDIFWFDFDETFLPIDSGPLLSYNNLEHRASLHRNIEFIQKVMKKCRDMNPAIKFGILSRRVVHTIRDFLARYHIDPTVVENHQKKIEIEYIVGSGNDEFSALSDDTMRQVYRILKLKNREWNYLKKQKNRRSAFWGFIKGCVVFSCKSGILLDDKHQYIKIFQKNGGIYYSRQHIGIHLKKPHSMQEFSHVMERLTRQRNITNPFEKNNIDKMRQIIKRYMTGKSLAGNANIDAYLNKYWRIIKDEINQYKKLVNKKLVNKKLVNKKRETMTRAHLLPETTSIMTYNVSWKTINLEKMEPRCKNNICTTSIARILSDNAEKYHLDFIYLQEVQMNNPNEWGNLRAVIQRVNQQFFDKYAVTGMDRPNGWDSVTPYLAGNIILYNRDKYNLLKDKDGRDMVYCINAGRNVADYRPVVFALFEERNSGQKIICINVHFTHDIQTHNQTYETIRKIVDGFRKVVKYRDAQILLAGDFNHKPVIENVRYLMNNSAIRDYRPSDIKTCCNRFGDIRKQHLEFWGDHLFSSTGKMKYILPDVLKYNRISSDHIPIIAIIDTDKTNSN